jgi:hypothetical protein
LGKGNSELVSSGTSDESVQKMFDAILEKEDKEFEKHKHPYTYVQDLEQSPVREVKLNGEIYYVCARSTNAHIEGGDPRNSYDVSNEKKLSLYVLAPNGSITRYDEETVAPANIHDHSVLDINEIRKKTTNQDLADVIDKFFLVTPEERQAFNAGEKHPDMYTQINPKDFVKGIKEFEPFHYEPQYYAKSARISARPGKVGEEITTVMKDGHKETTNTVKNEGDMVATNPNGEQYIIDAKTFAKKYEIDPHNPERYRPVGGAQEFMTLGGNVMFKAPWGEQMMIKKGGVLNVTNMDDIYGIQQQEFQETYAPCDKDGNFSRQSLRKLLREAHTAGERKHLATQLNQGDEKRNARAEELHKMRKTRDEYNVAKAALVARRAKTGGE